MHHQKLNRAWEKLSTLPMPHIASDRLAELHNDVNDYDNLVSVQVTAYLQEGRLDWRRVKVDEELEASLRSFRVETSAELEGRRDLLNYKRCIDRVVRELLRIQKSDRSDAETGQTKKNNKTEGRHRWGRSPIYAP